MRSANGRERLRLRRTYIRRREALPTDRKRIKTYVRSLDDILGGGIPEGFIVLLNGAPGTMKSSLAYSFLYQNALRENRKSAYFTLEQGKDLTLEHMASLGMADPRASEHITTLDMGNIRKNLNYLQGRGTWLDLFKMYCNNVMKAEPISMLVVDSLDVLETMAKMEDRRSELYFLFEWLRDLKPLTFLISEKPLGASGSQPPEEAYLADGIVALEMHPTSDLFVQRRLRVVKMRSTKHETGYYALSFEDGGFEVTRAVTGAS
jgi:circadian clock protein KaiC